MVQNKLCAYRDILNKSDIFPSEFSAPLPFWHARFSGGNGENFDLRKVPSPISTTGSATFHSIKFATVALEGPCVPRDRGLENSKENIPGVTTIS